MSAPCQAPRSPARVMASRSSSTSASVTGGWSSSSRLWSRLSADWRVTPVTAGYTTATRFFTSPAATGASSPVGPRAICRVASAMTWTSFGSEAFSENRWMATAATGPLPPSSIPAWRSYSSPGARRPVRR